MIATPEIIQSQLAPSFLPATAVLEMTYRCNHACLFCSCPWFSERGDFPRRPELSAAEWKAVIRRLLEMGVCDLAFTGGEPLLKEGLFEIIEFAAAGEATFIETVDGALQTRRDPPSLHLLSNGLAMTREVLKLCRRLNIQLSMSLPGLTTLQEHTGAGDPDRILRWFQEAKALGGIVTVAGVTVTRKNLPELYETISAALLAGADSLLMNRFLPGGRGISYAAELSLTKAQIVQMLDTAEEVLKQAGRTGSVGTELPKCVVDPSRYKQLQVGTRCSAGLSFFAIDPSGYVRACNHSPVRLVHFREIEKLKLDPYWRRFTQKDYLPAACGGCALAHDCDGGCREAAHICGGALDAPDPCLAADVLSAHWNPAAGRYGG
jgi:radical SAM protein with 4Fe4S-binding SPASM domain